MNKACYGCPITKKKKKKPYQDYDPNSVIREQ